MLRSELRLARVGCGDDGIKGAACERDTVATAKHGHAPGCQALHPKGERHGRESCTRICCIDAPKAWRGDNGTKAGTFFFCQHDVMGFT
jgi:hypothetical protein